MGRLSSAHRELVFINQVWTRPAEVEHLLRTRLSHGARGGSVGSLKEERLSTRSRLVAASLTGVLALGAAPAVALAEPTATGVAVVSEEAASTVATVGEQSFSTLEAAIAAADAQTEDTDTVILPRTSR